MRSQIYLGTLALLGSFAEALPQVIVDPGRSTITLPGGDPGYTFTIPGYSFPDSGITRTATLSGITIGDPGTTSTTSTLPRSTLTTSSTSTSTSSSSTPSSTKTTSSSTVTTPSPTPTSVSSSSTKKTISERSTSSVKSTSSTSKTSSSTTSSIQTTPTPTPTSTSTPTPTPSSSTKSTTSSSTTSTVVSTTSSTTSSSFSLTRTSTPTPTPTPTTISSVPVTTPPITSTTTVSSFTSSPTNPYNKDCAVPGTFAIQDWLFVSGPGGSVSFTLSYGNGLFSCPNSDAHSIFNLNTWTVQCDDDSLTSVTTDGVSWIIIKELSWCNDIPQPATGMITLQAGANVTNLGDYLSCETDPDSGIETCFQTTSPFLIPVANYAPGGAIGWEPIDLNGKYLSQCVTITSANPIVTNTATCTTTPKPTTTVTNVQTNTVVVNGGGKRRRRN